MVENHRRKDVQSAQDTGISPDSGDASVPLFLRVAQEGKDKNSDTQKLATGDTLTRSADGQTLAMPDGQKLIFNYGDPFTSPSIQMLDKKGNPVEIQYAATITTLPEVTVSNFSNGAKAEARPDVGTIIFPNGDKIVYDQTGIATITRGGKSVKLHEPQYEEIQLPGSDNKKRVV